MNKERFLLINPLSFVGTCWILLEHVGTALCVPTMLERIKMAKSAFLMFLSCFWCLLDLLEQLERKSVS